MRFHKCVIARPDPVVDPVVCFLGTENIKNAVALATNRIGKLQRTIMGIAKSIQASVGIANGKQCYNLLPDQDTVRSLLNLIGTLQGGAFGTLDKPTKHGICSPQLHSAILNFQRMNHLSVDGHVDPNQRTIHQLVGLADPDKPNIVPSDLFIPKNREHMPGFDILAPDGVIIDFPRAKVINGKRKTLRHDDAEVNVFIEIDPPTGRKRYVVVIDNPTDETPSGPLQPVPKAVAAAIAKKVVKKRVPALPKLFGRALVFGAGKIVGGVVSVAASVLDPSPIGQVLVWDAKQDELLVHYVIINP